MCWLGTLFRTLSVPNTLFPTLSLSPFEGLYKVFTVFGTDVRSRCSEQTMFGTVFRANTAYKTLVRSLGVTTSQSSLVSLVGSTTTMRGCGVWR